jgi:hypothetical protein
MFDFLRKRKLIRLSKPTNVENVEAFDGYYEGTYFGLGFLQNYLDLAKELLVIERKHRIENGRTVQDVTKLKKLFHDWQNTNTPEKDKEIKLRAKRVIACDYFNSVKDKGGNLESYLRNKLPKQTV